MSHYIVWTRLCMYTMTFMYIDVSMGVATHKFADTKMNYLKVWVATCKLLLQIHLLCMFLQQYSHMEHTARIILLSILQNLMHLQFNGSVCVDERHSYH